MPSRTVPFTLIAVIFLGASALTPAYAQFNPLYDFGTKSGDPNQPSYSGIIAQGPDGALYTTAPQGGSAGKGAVLRIIPDAVPPVTVLHSFHGGDGSSPEGGLTLSNDGTLLYGTTCSGGTSNAGTIFTVTAGGSFHLLYNFTGGADGKCPYSPPIEGTDGNFYGTTTAGGTGNGVVYKITPAGVPKTLYPFDITHGLQPYAPLVQGIDGNFYGTTSSGGNNHSDAGVIFKITPTGKLTVIYNFDGLANGGLPFGPLVQGVDGEFYGTTLSSTGPTGVVFKVSAGGEFKVLHTMNGTSDGESPYGGLVLASDLNFYGVNSAGGGLGFGTIFKMTSSGALSVVHDFDGTTGSTPEVTLNQHTNSILYGDTKSGGTGKVSPCTTGKCGVFYGLNQTLRPFIKLLPPTGRVGSKIGILGQGFNSTSVVRFNGARATTITVVSPNFILATVPLGTLDGFVSVKTGTVKLVSVQQFIVHDSWGLGTPMPTPRAGGAIGVIKGKIYVVSGEIDGATTGNNEIYNPTSGEWITGKSIPIPVFVPASAVVNNILYVIGGIANTSTGAPTSFVQAYNPNTNSWTPKTPMPTPMDSMNAVVDGGFIYVIGGFDGAMRSAVVQRYDPATDTWASPPPAPLQVAKSDSAVGVINSTIISAGGLANTGASHDNEGYSPATNTWKILESDTTTRDGQCGATVGNLFYVVGGSTTGVFNTTALTESYNLTTNKWMKLSPAFFAQTLAMPASVNGQLFCIGGTDDGLPFQGTMFNYVQIYQP